MARAMAAKGAFLKLDQNPGFSPKVRTGLRGKQLAADLKDTYNARTFLGEDIDIMCYQTLTCEGGDVHCWMSRQMFDRIFQH